MAHQTVEPAMRILSTTMRDKNTKQTENPTEEPTNSHISGTGIITKGHLWIHPIVQEAFRDYQRPQQTTRDYKRLQENNRLQKT